MNDSSLRAKEVAKIIAAPGLSNNLYETGVIAISPEHFNEMLERCWKNHLVHSEHLVERIHQLILDHPQGAEGLKKDLREAYQEYAKTLPVEDL
jgi:hypothetical protein